MSMKICCHLNHLPEEILYDVFSRLPIKSLCQCRLVCKHWFKIWSDSIKNQSFIKLHHSRLNQDQPDFLILYFAHQFGSCIYMVNHDAAATTTTTTTTTPLNAIKLYTHLYKERITIYGSCNGLLCLCMRPDYDCFFICNPITKETIKLPKPHFGFTTYPTMGCFIQLPRRGGFVFDATINRYKVIHSWSPSHDTTGFQIYTLGTGVWRRIEDLPSYICEDSRTELTQVLLNGALHWLVTDTTHPKYTFGVAALDISTEKFARFKGPSGVSVPSTTLCCIGNYLCVIENIRGGDVLLWVMKDYGVNESWTKDYLVRHKRHREWLYGSLVLSFKIVRIEGLGNVIIHGDRYPPYYDFKEIGETKHLVIQGIPSPSYELVRVVHVGSLISPKLLDSVETQT